MTLDELKGLVTRTEWFGRVGTFPGDDHMIPIRQVRADGAFDIVVDFDTPGGPDLAVEWQWLPTTKEEPDPIYNASLKELAKQTGKETAVHEAVLEIYRTVLSCLAKVERHSSLQVGHHDSTNAAKGGALYATRMAATEIVLGKEGFWCSAVRLYAAGYWPRGITKTGDLLVF